MKQNLTVGCPFAGTALKRPEPYAGKLARTVLRGGDASNGFSLPDRSLTGISPDLNYEPAFCGLFSAQRKTRKLPYADIHFLISITVPKNQYAETRPARFYLHNA